MKIKIVKSSDPNFWYANEIGEIFNLAEKCIAFDNQMGGEIPCFRIYLKDGSAATVHQADCEVLTP